MDATRRGPIISLVLALIIGAVIVYAMFGRLPTDKTAPQPAAPPQNSTPDAAQPLDFEPDASPPGPREYRLRVFHKHGIGNCDGVLIFTNARVRYVTHSEDAFDFARDGLRQDDDGFVDRSGRVWHFSSPYGDVREVVRKWLGEPRLSETPGADQSPAADTAPARTLKVKHKHLFGSCDGTLTLSPAAISFKADEGKDSFTLAIDQAKLDGDGVTGPTGKGWHFKSDGVNVEEILRAWKSSQR
jgi:hypothetical protein